jgi:energy-coupling factor transporter transmembrane protein EcfT
MVFGNNKPAAILLFFLLLVGSILFLGLPLKNKIYSGILFLLLVWVSLPSAQPTNVGQFVLAIGKVTSMFMVVALFSMTTRLSSIIQLLDPKNTKHYTLSQMVYVINTTLAIAPSIQYDLQRAIDSETIRRGKKIGIFSFDSWVSILTITLVRTLNRSERFTDTVLDRGFVPSQGMRALSERPLNKYDVILSFLLIAPALMIWFFTL